MKKKNLFKHYFALMTMLFVVSGSFVSNVMAADVDYQVICSGNTVKLLPLSDEGNNTSASNALTNCSFCNLGEDEDFYTSFATSETFAGRSQVLKKV